MHVPTLVASQVHPSLLRHRREEAKGLSLQACLDVCMREEALADEVGRRQRRERVPLGVARRRCPWHNVSLTVFFPPFLPPSLLSSLPGLLLSVQSPSKRGPSERGIVATPSPAYHPP